MGSTGKAPTTSLTPPSVTPEPETPEVNTTPKGETEDAELEKVPSNDENDLNGVAELMNSKGEHTWAAADKWFGNEKISNYKEWESQLSSSEENAIHYYISSQYQDLNDSLYMVPWDSMSAYEKKKASALYEAINKFELNKAVKLLRKCDFQIFGLPKGSKLTADQLTELLTTQTDTFQTNGFLSFTTDIKHGTFSHSKGLVIDFVMPPNKGGGAWIGGFNVTEQEFLLNSNAVLRFDPKSVHTDSNGVVHVSATWVGQAADQAFNGKKK